MNRHCSVCHLPGHDKRSHARRRRNPQFRTTTAGVVYPLRGTDGPGGPYNSLKTKKPAFTSALRYLGEAKAKELYPRRYAAYVQNNERSRKADELEAQRRGEKAHQEAEAKERRRQQKTAVKKKLAALDNAEAEAKAKPKKERPYVPPKPAPSKGHVGWIPEFTTSRSTGVSHWTEVYRRGRSLYEASQFSAIDKDGYRTKRRQAVADVKTDDEAKKAYVALAKQHKGARKWANAMVDALAEEKRRKGQA